jgi:tetratricopeptide (TPR) repeat protein
MCTYKKVKIISYIIVIATLSVSLFSCKKYLDKKSNSALVTPSTIEDLQSLLDDADYMNYNTTSNYVLASDDDYFATSTILNALTDNDRNAYKWQRFDYFISNDWSAAYLPVYNANLCLEQLEKIQKTGANWDKWNNIKGSALFLRAYYFLNLAWAYSKAYDDNTSSNDLGIALRLTSDFNVSSTRAKVSETYDRIIEDAKNSLEFLPDNPQHVMRPSKAAAYGLLARTYLSMSKYDSALKYSNLCLSINNTLFDFKTDINPTAALPFLQFNKETLFYTEANGNFLSINLITRATVDTTLVASYQGNDIRKTAYFKTSRFYAGGKLFKGSYTGQFKYFSGIATDEMYLIRAECYARTGNKDAAMTDLNYLMSKRYDATFVPLTAADATDALSKILIERRKELLMRGLRWMDIKRLNKEGANITLKRLVDGQTYSLLPNADFYALPLPKDIIDQTGMPQN